MATLTREERLWVRRLQRALDSCPSDRIGFATIGDAYLSLHDRTKEDAIHATMDREGCDFDPAVQVHDADFGETLRFPSLVHSVAG